PIAYLLTQSSTRNRLIHVSWARLLLAVQLFLFFAQFNPLASENVPRKPFAEWADLPKPQQLSVRLWYQEGEAYHIWDGQRVRNVTLDRGSEEYGIDRMQGIVAIDYGVSERWAADVNLGYGTVGTRSFNPTGRSESTTGILDTSLGVRYQILRENESNRTWLPTLTFRAGAVLPGSFDKEFPFAPGHRSAAIEPGFLVKKHFAWPGFGMYCDAFYRWMKTTRDDQYAIAVGFLQEIKGWTINAGYRHFQQISGSNLQYHGLGQPLEYSPEIREISDAIEAGFSYTTPKRSIRYGFHTRKTLDGSNTDAVLWISGYVEIPIETKFW
ncbi:MAG: transporter, partial [Verrucomicrobiae bacterium]|nr:transporter [Verrucomicrobiae bacterium]